MRFGYPLQALTGFMFLLAEDVETTTLTDGEIYRKDGHRYFRLKNIDTKPKIGDLVIKANGIFADPELGEFLETKGKFYLFKN